MSRTFYVVLLVSAVAISLSSADSEEVNNVSRDSLTFTLPNPFGSEPFFETRNENGRMIGFHIPFLVDWKFHNREGDGILNTRYSWRLLSGLVNFNIDRIRNPETGEMQGPVQWSVLGIPLLDNGETTPAPPVLPPSE